LRPRPDDAALTDADVVHRVLNDDVDAFQLLVRRHQAAAFRFANALVLDADVAADLVQDAFVRAFVNLARCRNPERFRVWLMRMVRNRAVDYQRERRRRDASLSDEHVRHRVDARAHTEAASVHDAAAAAELERALAALSQPLREAFVLRHVEDLSTAEVAELLGTGVSAVKMRVQRARLQLQRLLDRSPGASGAEARDVTRQARDPSDA
jgi:RNA polymerase sigma-70 factor, ECF subfamily